MNNSELSYKLKYILHELGLNKTEFLNACRLFSPSISKPTILNAINGKNTIAPTIETLSTIIKVCQTSGNEKLKYISYDFLLNDNIKEIEAKNSSIYQEIGLNDDVIERLKQYNHPLYYDYLNIINYYFIHIPANYWRYLEMIKTTCDIKKLTNKINKDNIEKLTKSILKLFDNDIYLEYLQRNFKNIYDLYIGIKNSLTNKDSILFSKLEELDKLMRVLYIHFKYLLLELNNKLYDDMNL